MANGCALFGGIVPNVYIDQVFLEESRQDTDNDGKVDLETPMISINMKLVDQPGVDGTFSLLGDALSLPGTSLDLKQYFEICCLITTTPEATEYWQQFFAGGNHMPDGITANTYSVPPNTGAENNSIVKNKVFSDFQPPSGATYVNSDGTTELIKSYGFKLEDPSMSTLKHLTVFAFLRVRAIQLEQDWGVTLPSNVLFLSSPIAQELVIQNSQVVSQLRLHDAQGDTMGTYVTIDPRTGQPFVDAYNNPLVVPAHAHSYSDLDSNGNGYTSYAADPEESNIRHRHKVVNGIVQEAQSECWSQEDSAMFTGEMVEQAKSFVPVEHRPVDERSCLFLYGNPGAGPHTHELTPVFTPVFNVQDFRIRNEIDVLVTELTRVTQTQLEFPEQRDILNQLNNKNSYFTELLLSKDSRRNVRYLFGFDYGKYVIDNSKYSSIIKKMSPAARQQVAGNSEITKFILSRRQVEEKPALNILASPVHNRVTKNDPLETPVALLDLRPGPGLAGLETQGGTQPWWTQNVAIQEIELMNGDMPSNSSSLIRYFTGIDWLMTRETDGQFQYAIDVEILDGFIPLMNTIYPKLSKALIEYRKYVNLIQIPGVYDRLSRKFTATATPPQTMSGQNIMAGATENQRLERYETLSRIVDIYLDSLGYFVDLSQHSDPGEYKNKIMDLITAWTRGDSNTGPHYKPAGPDGVLLFENLLELLLTQLNTVMSTGHSSGGVEDTVQNSPSDSATIFKIQTMTIKEYFDNTINARFTNEKYVDNITAGDPEGGILSVYNKSSLEGATITEVDLNETRASRTYQEMIGDSGISVNVKLPATTYQAPQATTGVGAFLGFGPGESDGLNSDSLSPGALENTTYDFDLTSFLDLAVMVTTRYANRTKSGNASNLQNRVLVFNGFRTTPQDDPTREILWDSKTLNDLIVTTSPAENRYYLCYNRVRVGIADDKSNKETLDRYFLLRPPTS